ARSWGWTYATVGVEPCGDPLDRAFTAGLRISPRIELNGPGDRRDSCIFGSKERQTERRTRCQWEEASPCCRARLCWPRCWRRRPALIARATAAVTSVPDPGPIRGS